MKRVSRDRTCDFPGKFRVPHSGKTSIAGKVIALAVKRAVFRAALVDGHDKRTAYALANTVGGHSLPAGFVTAADAAGAPIAKVMQQARHASFETTRGYIREADALKGTRLAISGYSRIHYQQRLRRRRQGWVIGGFAA
jgi:hypothetical protein